VEPSPSETRYGSSLFFGADTWPGPFYLGLGLSGGGNTTGYVIIGELVRVVGSRPLKTSRPS